MGKWLAEGHKRDTTALWKDNRHISERNLHHTVGGQNKKNIYGIPFFYTLKQLIITSTESHFVTS